jgi:hypothetical protein
MTVTDTLEGMAASTYRFFAKSGPAFGDFQRSQTTTDAANNLELQVNIGSADGP